MGLIGTALLVLAGLALAGFGFLMLAKGGGEPKDGEDGGYMP